MTAPVAGDRVVAVVPAAGHGTRLREGAQPWQGSKEVLPVGGRPVIDHLLERLRDGGADEIRVVTRPDKTDLIEHLRRQGCTVVLGAPADVSQSIALGLVGLAADDVVLSGFPDTLWSPSDGFQVLRAALGGVARVALGLFALPDVRAADEVVMADGRVLAVHPKPVAPRSPLTWGCFAARCDELTGMTAWSEPGRWWHQRATDRPESVVGVLLGEDFVDVGTPAGLARAGGPSA